MTLIVTVTLPMVASAAREGRVRVRVREPILGHQVKTWESRPGILLVVER